MKRPFLCLLLWFSLLLLVALLSACDKAKGEYPEDPDEPDSPEVNIEDAPVLPVSVVGESFTDYIESVTWTTDSTEQTIVLKESVPAQMVPKAGTIMVVDECGMFPFGFGATINSVDRSDKIVLHCTAPNLSQFAESFDLSTDSETLSAELVDVADDNGNPIDYELVEDEEGSRASFEHGVDNKIVSLPFNISVSNGTAWDKLSFSGRVYCGFKHLGIRINKPAGGRMTTSFDIEPIAGISATSTVTCKVSATKNIRLGQMRFIVRGSVGGVPVILPVTFYVYFVAEASGEIKCELELSSEYNASYTVSDATGRWSSVKNNDKKEVSNPWAVGSLDLSGSISVGIKCGVMIGLYSSTVGVGLNITPKYTLSASASLSSEDLYKINPEVGNKVEVESEVYCTARIFGKELGKYSYEFPAISLFDESLHLFPGISNFKAECKESSSAVVTYEREKRFFLEGLSAEEGLALLDDKMELISYQNTLSTGVNDKNISKKYVFSNLAPNRDYYVAPYYKIFGKTFLGDSHNIRTKAEKRHYRLTIQGGYYTELVPPVAYFDVEVYVDSNNRVQDVTLTGSDGRNYWVIKDEVNEGEAALYYDKSNISIEAYPEEFSICQNSKHNHDRNRNGIGIIIRSNSETYYMMKEEYSSGYNPKMYSWWFYPVQGFIIGLDEESATSCWGQTDWYNDGVSHKGPCIFDGSISLKRVDNEE